jgi:hypothetical protein
MAAIPGSKDFSGVTKEWREDSIRACLKVQ